MYDVQCTYNVLNTCSVSRICIGYVHCTTYNVRIYMYCTLYVVHCAYSVRRTLYVQCTSYMSWIQCTMYIVAHVERILYDNHCTMNNVQWITYSVRRMYLPTIRFLLSNSLWYLFSTVCTGTHICIFVQKESILLF